MNEQPPSQGNQPSYLATVAPALASEDTYTRAAAARKKTAGSRSGSSEILR